VVPIDSEVPPRHTRRDPQEVRTDTRRMSGAFLAAPFRELGILVEPIKVGFRTGDDGKSDEFRDLVAVQAFHFPFKTA
jgi:hypothetical protein